MAPVGSTRAATVLNRKKNKKFLVCTILLPFCSPMNEKGRNTSADILLIAKGQSINHTFPWARQRIYRFLLVMRRHLNHSKNIVNCIYSLFKCI